MILLEWFANVKRANINNWEKKEYSTPKKTLRIYIMNSALNIFFKVVVPLAWSIVACSIGLGVV